MGYSSGSEGMGRIVKSILANADSCNIPEHQLYSVFTTIVKVFEDMDSDTLDECYGICATLDKVLDDNGWAPED